MTQYPGPPQGDGSADPNNPYRYGLPAAPPAYPQPAASRGPRPKEVLTAVRLMYLRAAIGVVSLIVLFATKHDLTRQVRRASPNLTTSDVDNAVTIGVVIGVVLLVLYVVLAFVVSRGRNWARIVTWVIAGLGILGFLGTLASPETGFTRLLGVVTLLIDIAVVVLLALRPSNEYFAGPRY